MRGRDFLTVAKEVVQGKTEAHWRAAVGRAYYALVQETWAALDRWGITSPPRVDIHFFTRSRLTIPSDADLRKIGNVLEEAGRLRNYADYRLASAGQFSSSLRARNIVVGVGNAMNLLDSLDTDPLRRVAAVAAIRAAFGL